MRKIEFNEQIKKLRTQNHLTQDQMAKKLNVTRQAISNWENNRNLPDFEMVILIARIFNISLDELILGDQKVNKIEKTLINDGKRTRAAKFNLVTSILGSLFVLLGILLFFISANSVSYVDKQGMLHENFFLIPLAYLAIFIGLIIFISLLVNIFRFSRK